MWDVTVDRALIQSERPDLKFKIGDHVQIETEHGFDCIVDDEAVIVAIDWSDPDACYAVSSILPVLDKEDCLTLSATRAYTALEAKYNKQPLPLAWVFENQLELAAVQMRVCILENVRPVVAESIDGVMWVDAACGCGRRFDNLGMLARHIKSSTDEVVDHWETVADWLTQQQMKDDYWRTQYETH